jgi:hypothetical protein
VQKVLDSVIIGRMHGLGFCFTPRSEALQWTIARLCKDMLGGEGLRLPLARE